MIQRKHDDKSFIDSKYLKKESKDLLVTIKSFKKAT